MRLYKLNVENNENAKITFFENFVKIEYSIFPIGVYETKHFNTLPEAIAAANKNGFMYFH